MKEIARNKSAEDYRHLRAKLLRRGMTLRGFAISRGHCIQFVYDAASGRRTGPKAKKIREQLEELIK